VRESVGRAEEAVPWGQERAKERGGERGRKRSEERKTEDENRMEYEFKARGKENKNAKGGRSASHARLIS